MSDQIYIEDVAISCALGYKTEEILANLRLGNSPGMQGWHQTLFSGRHAYVGRLTHELEKMDISDIPDNRNNQLAQFLVSELSESFKKLHQRFPANRIGVVIGSSTSGISVTEKQIAEKVRNGEFPSDYSYQHQDMGDVAKTVAKLANAKGPAYTVSTACTSSSRALISAAKLIRANICDAVICGGIDTLCDLTVNGFDSLEQVSDQACRPFDPNRKGINVAEGGALLIVTAQSSDILLAGYGESSDAHHLSSPMPCGTGAYNAMSQALTMSGLKPEHVDYINAHGTSTQQNDAMESQAISNLFTDTVPVSSTKALTGHCLGAAGAVEAVMSCLLLRDSEQPLPRQWPAERSNDDDIAAIGLVGEKQYASIDSILSNSFAFGGNNASLLFTSKK
ncbi:beta-ketoacyl-[acyl-carrier-protein] synthase II [Vibrio sp. 10N.286.49.B3]|uniref:beta-ketoacyl-ACP synthase n=1 Tax=Vibrio sp. 10N.286.49.B3 TaxID=1880855 RepID=UPI000C82878E|nr:beta-ketoacyl-ACP synthase [Vibrio sp. 10N.286.49.B3]PMH44590.1 beta-ketoacyl-[acyl-carrier-protein] synthase II [Vibrio sp. 10N.286.49.B3]